MSLYLVAGAGASTGPVDSDEHLPSARTRRYPSDMTDAEWAVLAPLVPAGRPGPRGGRPPEHSRRDIIDAIRYVTHNSCVWRALPADFPPWKTVYDYHAEWTRDGTVNRIHNALRERVRVAEGREPDPSAALVDSQSVRAAETVTKSNRGFDGGKKVTGPSGTSPPTPPDCCWSCWSPPRASRTATAAGCCSGRCTAASRRSPRSGQTAATRGNWSTGPPPSSSWASRSYASSPARSAFRSYPADGWSSGPCRGLPATDEPSVTMSDYRHTTPHSSTGR